MVGSIAWKSFYLKNNVAVFKECVSLLFLLNKGFHNQIVIKVDYFAYFKKYCHGFSSTVCYVSFEWDW